MTMAAPVLVILDDDPVRCAVYQCTFEGGSRSEFQLAFPRTLDAGSKLAETGRVAAVLCARPLLTPEFRNLAEALRRGALAGTVWLTVEEADDGMEDTARTELAGLQGDDEIPIASPEEPPADLPFPFEAELLKQVLDRHRSGVRPARSPTPPPPAAPVVTPPPAPRQPTPAPDPWVRFGERVGQLHANLDRITYYQLLGVEDDAEAGRIKAAYEQRSLELHPDRFLQLQDTALREKLYTIYKRVVEAFRVLDSPQHRATYDRHLATRSGSVRLVTTERKKQELAKNPWDFARTSSGKTLLRSAIESLRGGQHRKALQLFQAALQLEPDNAAIRERYEEARKLFGSSEH